METIKVLIADGCRLVREGIRAMLETDKGIEVVGEATDGVEAVDKVHNLQPDVVLMDIATPALGDLEATRRIKRQHPSINVIVFTSCTDEAFVLDAIQAGATGYLLHDATREILNHTIRAVSSGSILIKSSLLRKAVASLINLRMEYQKRSAGPLGGVEEFTGQEQRVLRLVVEGGTNKEIGRELNISEETVKKHLQNIMAKLGVSDRTQAAVKALQIGLVKPSEAQYEKQHF